jgi:hypothetical protein
MPLSPVDSNGNDLGRDALMQAAQRYGGDAILVGRGDFGGANGQWQWTLYTNFSNESWKGSLSAGIDGSVDSLASPQGASLSQTESSARVEVGGVSALPDYVFVERLLESLPGVRRVNVAVANGATITFDVLARGGAEAISQGLGGSPHLVPSDTANAQLLYQYKP